MIPTKFPVGRDIFERVAATFVVSVLGLATADGVDLQSVLSVDNWKTWLTAGVIAAFTLVKALIATAISGKGASLAPGVALEPLDEGERI